MPFTSSDVAPSNLFPPSSLLFFSHFFVKPSQTTASIKKTKTKIIQLEGRAKARSSDHLAFRIFRAKKGRKVSDMSDSRDPAIRLFGKTIALPCASDEGGGDDDKRSPNKDMISTPERNDKEEESPNSEEKTDTGEIELVSSCDDRETTATISASEKDQPKVDEEKLLKKPDKILPCPRCNSMDTKFCYYNNYNVNQPRHFCKNCHRYWTAGGTMRNVPVGAGRRKNKNSAAANHYHHLTITEAALQAIPDHQHALKPNGTVLSFGSDTPICESMATVLNLSENRNRFHRIDEQQQMEEQQSTGSCNSTDHLQETGVRNGQSFAPPNHTLPYINGFPWPYPWNPPPPPPPSAAAPLCASSFPIPIYPATAYWGCGPWSIPWLAPPLASPPAASGGSSGSGPNSPTLGKHSRDGNVLMKNNSSSSGSSDKQGERCLWIPKTLRIDDPDEAAKSSIWATMGFKNDKAGAADGLFKSFQTTKGELNSAHKVLDASQLPHANPAALSRSINFQES